jgi:hypothetical protein
MGCTIPLTYQSVSLASPEAGSGHSRGSMGRPTLNSYEVGRPILSYGGEWPLLRDLL